MVKIHISKSGKAVAGSGTASLQEDEVESKAKDGKSVSLEEDSREKPNSNAETADLDFDATTTAAGEEQEVQDGSREEELEQLRWENQSLKEQILRVRAEAENFRKRLQREKDEFVRFAREGFIRELLPVKDNLERALAHAEQEPASIVDGVRMTVEQFASILKNMGVEPVEAVGQPFDPALHEAMTQVESSEHEPNSVVAELQKGYTLHGRLLRPAMVSVAKAPVVEKTEK